MAVLPRPSVFCIVEVREVTEDLYLIILALMKMDQNTYFSLISEREANRIHRHHLAFLLETASFTAVKCRFVLLLFSFPDTNIALD